MSVQEPGGIPGTANQDPAFGENPFLSAEPGSWDRLIQATGPASMLVWIHSRMGALERGQTSAEDIWQETLLHAWRDRERLRWRGLRAFRRLLLEIAHNRIRDDLDRHLSQKRGGGQVALPKRAPDGAGSASSCDFGEVGPVASTTPSRIAMHKEQADAMHQALQALSAEEREVVLLRLFEDLSMDEVAARVGTSLSTAKRRYRRGIADYSHRLENLIQSHDQRAG